MGSSFSSAFANVFLFYYETNFIKHNINFFRYIDDIIVFNCDNFEDISLYIYRKELVLKKINSINFSSSLDLKINFANNNWFISVHDKRLDFNFKVWIDLLKVWIGKS